MNFQAHQENVKKQLLRDDVRNAFKSWFAKKYPGMESALAKALNNPMPGTWQVFTASEAYKALSFDKPVVQKIAEKEV